jgi:diacylglycerol kinase (ATP)
MTSPLLVFVNRNSGGGFALNILSQIEQDPSIHLVLLSDDASTWSARRTQILRDPTLRCVSCGGDGTSNWVVTLLNNHFGVDASVRRPIAMLPFGTGNDMSRVQGWGALVSNRQIRHTERLFGPVRRSNIVKKVDVWRITIERTDTHDVTVRYMLNYFSLGCDAEIA